MQSEKVARLNPDLAKTPVLDNQPGELIHTRRNLLIITSLYLFCSVCDVSFVPKFFNENFIEGELTESDVLLGIALAIVYLFISFLWKFNDFYHSQNILNTNDIKLYSVSNFGDVTEKQSFRLPSQYSLSGWWARTSEIMEFHYNRIEKTIEDLDIHDNIRSQVDLIRSDSRSIADMYRAASNDDVINSLKNFDNSVIRFIYSQRLRIFIIDWYLPVLMTAAALGLLTGDLLFIATTK